MIDVAFFDVDETLLHLGKPMPGVLDALNAIVQLNSASGHPLLMGVVFNNVMPSQPVTETEVLAIEAQFRKTVLEPSGLANFFDPFETKATISSRVGISMPNRGVFENALVRLHSSAALDECLFITAEASHLSECKGYGMIPIRFGSDVPGIRCFSNWCDAPLLLANVVAPDNMQNVAIAIAPALASHHGLKAFASTNIHGKLIHGRAKQLFQLNDPRLGALDGIYVERSAEVTVEITSQGSLGNVQTAEPGPDEISDAVNFVHTLIQGGRIAHQGESRGTTHAVQLDASGREVLIRQRYAAC